ncbi:MAG: large subunit ribosomal protein, partial [Acidimicrobiaceae bacterium]|nr:large subunit ribosomal protein [Acidimicrobiaceae bacterium]
RRNSDGEPMENPRPEKVAVVDEVRDRFADADAVLLTEYRGLTVAALAALRRQLRPAGGDYKVYKNTLVRFAARELGVEGSDELFIGPTAIAFVKGDAAAVAKSLRDFARTNPNLVVKGGFLGTKVLSPAEVTTLADLPSRETLLAQLAGAFQAPIQQFAGLLQALPRNFAYGLKALLEKSGGVPIAADDQTEGTATATADQAEGATAIADQAEGATATADQAEGATATATADQADTGATATADQADSGATATATAEQTDSGATAAADESGNPTAEPASTEE